MSVNLDPLSIILRFSVPSSESPLFLFPFPLDSSPARELLLDERSVEGQDVRGYKTYPDTVAPRLVEASFADRVGENKAICSSSPGQETTPTVLSNRMSPVRTLSVVVMCILSQYLPLNLSNDFFPIAFSTGG
jgi:hypothetical protein